MNRRFIQLSCLACSTLALAPLHAAVLEEIMVTAQKRSESVQDVAISINVIGGDKLERADIGNLEELTLYVPNYYQARSVVSAEVYIRGVGSSSNPGFEQSVGMFADGVYWGRSLQTTTPLFDLARIEVLKGPQSILFGKNTVAGAVSMHSRQPTDTLEGRLTALTGTDGQRKTEAVISGPLSDTVSARLALLGRSSDGYIDNSYDNSSGPASDQWGLRGIIQWQPSAELSATLKLERTDNKVAGSPHVIIRNTQVAGPGAPPFFTGIDSAPVQLTGVDDSDPYQTNIGNSAPLGGSDQAWLTHIDTSTSSLHLDYQWGEHTLTSITGYTAYSNRQNNDLDMTPASLIGIVAKQDFEQYSQELRIASPGGESFDYIAGLYWQRAKINAGPNQVGFQLSSIGLPALADGFRGTVFDQNTDTASAFLQGTWQLAEPLAFKAGLRYTHESKDVFRSVKVYDLDGQALLPGADDLALDLFWRDKQNTVPYETTDKRTENQLAPMLALEWSLLEDTLLYASMTRGYKSGGWDAIHTNGDDLEALAFDDEETLAYELGSKSTFLDNRATLNLALFYTEIDNLQVSIYDGAVGFNVKNAAAATSRGLELDGRLLLSEKLMLAGSVAYLDYRYDDYSNAPCTQSQFNDQFLASGSTKGCVQDLSGRESVYAPEWTGSFSVNYRTPISTQLAMDITLDANYRGDQYLAADLEPSLKQSGFWKLNARLAVEPLSGQWQLALIGKNLTNKTIYTFAGDAPLGNGTFFGISDPVGSFNAIPAAPRSIALEFSWLFQ